MTNLVEARQLLQKAEKIYISSVSLWEAAIKVGLGKLKVDMDDLDAGLRDTAFLPLPVTWAHATRLRQLPRLHGDPFDRMLVAQAISEPLHLLTHDAQLQPYSDLVMLI